MTADPLFVCLDASVLYDIGELAERGDVRVAELLQGFLSCAALPVITMATLVDYSRGDAPSRAKMTAAIQAFGRACCPCVPFDEADRAALAVAIVEWNRTGVVPAPRELQPQTWAPVAPSDLERHAHLAAPIAAAADALANAESIGRGATGMEKLSRARVVAKALVAAIDANDGPEQCLERIRVALGADASDELGVEFARSSFRPALEQLGAFVDACRAEGADPAERLAMLSQPGRPMVEALAADMKGKLDAFEAVASRVAPSLYLKYRLARHRRSQRDRTPMPSDTADEIQLSFAPYFDLMTVDANVLAAVRRVDFHRVRRGVLIANPPQMNWRPIIDALRALRTSDARR